MIVGSDNHSIKCESNVASFSLGSMIVPGIKPFFKLIDESSTRLKTEIIKNDGLVLLIATPPLVIFFKVGIRELGPGITGLTCTSGTIIPIAYFRISTRRNYDIIFLNSLDVSVVTKEDVSRNLI